MKTFFISFVILGFLLNQAKSQEPEICNDMTQRNPAFLEKSVIFNLAGINLTKYDWSNSTINCHINKTIYYQNKRGWNNYAGWSTLGAAGAAIPFGIGFTSNADGAWVLLGAAMVGVSVYFFKKAGICRKKSNFHLEKVSDYYRVNKLY